MTNWNVHHGDGTKTLTYDKNYILLISLRRHDYGSFYPKSGKHTIVRDGADKGFNLHIAFNNLSGGLSYVRDDE